MTRHHRGRPSPPVKTGGNQDALLEKGEIWTYECSQNLQNTTTNIATATGKDNLNTEVTDTDTVTVKVLKPGIKVVKTANKSEVKPGDPVKYTFVVTNTGTDALLKDVSPADDKAR
ncbi:MAG: DUF11 domain-containing protein [Micrococcales bacterium]|nr:DUF11 domain-containing protein [Micrococcales bacterium]